MLYVYLARICITQVEKLELCQYWQPARYRANARFGILALVPKVKWFDVPFPVLKTVQTIGIGAVSELRCVYNRLGTATVVRDERNTSTGTGKTENNQINEILSKSTIYYLSNNHIEASVAKTVNNL